MIMFLGAGTKFGLADKMRSKWAEEKETKG